MYDDITKKRMSNSMWLDSCGKLLYIPSLHGFVGTSPAGFNLQNLRVHFAIFHLNAPQICAPFPKASPQTITHHP